MTPADRARLRELLAKATPGPWRQGSVETGHVFGDIGNPERAAPELGRVLLQMNQHFPHEVDAALIADAVNALPGLLDALDKAEAERLTLARAMFYPYQEIDAACALARRIVEAVCKEQHSQAAMSECDRPRERVRR